MTLIEFENVLMTRTCQSSKVLTLDFPFPGTSEVQVIRKVVDRKERPGRPRECGDALWRLICSCWGEDHSLRPTAIQAQKMMTVLVLQTTS